MQQVFIDNPYLVMTEEKLKSLPPCHGYCILIDIANSTKLKNINYLHWIGLIYNTFQDIIKTRCYPFIPLKCIGDQLMYYIPQEEISLRQLLIIFNNLVDHVDNKRGYRSEVKVALTFCKNVYNITFFENIADFYGKDIDKSARFLSLAKTGQIIMNRPLYLKLIEASKSDTGTFYTKLINRIKGPFYFSKRPKGFTSKLKYFKFVGKRKSTFFVPPTNSSGFIKEKGH